MIPRWLVVLGILISCVVAPVCAANFTEFVADGDSWIANNDTHILRMWNATGSHTFVPPSGTTILSQYLVVAGGGGGGASGNIAGGGGAGGVITGYDFSISGMDSINITVGYPGLGAPSSSDDSTPGTNSSFANTTSGDGINAMGGGGGMRSLTPSGGSGGGGGISGNSANGIGIPGQGFDGGVGDPSSPYSFAGGGGGAGSAGGTGTVYNDGGSGIVSDITGIAKPYGGGGGGGGYNAGSNGVGGSGIGGNGALYNAHAGDAVPETGSGGGGGGLSGGDGSSGIVIISYEIPPPEVLFSAIPLEGHAPLNVTFTDEFTGTANYWNWSFGDGEYSDTQNPFHTYSQKGVYSVNLSVGSPGGNYSLLKTNYINVLNASELYPTISSDVSTGVIPLSVQFSDESSTFNATIDSWYWEFGDGNSSADQNPLYEYVGAGYFNSSLTITNTSFGISNTSETITITPYTPTGLVLADLYMEPGYTLTLHIVDEDGAPIPVCTVLSNIGAEYTTTNGTAYLSTSPTVLVVYVSSDGYVSRTTSYVMDIDRDETIQLATKSTPSTTTFWSPHNVEFWVVDANNQPLTATTVSISGIESTLPGGYSGCIESLMESYGISLTEAEKMLDSTTNMSGITDSTGSVTFLMLPTIGYTIRVGDGLYEVTPLYPKQEYYVIKTTSSTYTSPIDIGSYYTSESYDILNTSQPDVHHVRMQLFYYDHQQETDYIQFWVKSMDNETVVYTENATVGSSPILMNYTVENNRGERWRWGYDAHRI